MLRAPSYLSFILFMPLVACNGNSVTGGDTDGGSGTDSAIPCTNLECRIVDCQAQGRQSTTLKGQVNIPAGNLPLYNATVYVPNGQVAPIVTGASCDRCTDASSGQPIVTTTTDASGRFTLKDVPTGSNVPLVIQLGKWRRQITVSTVAECTDNTVDPTLTRLPRNQSEGDIPKIALATGGFDAIECLLRKIGIDDSEFTPESGNGRINLFAGHGGTNSYCTQGAGKCTKTLNGGAAFTVASDGATPGWWSSLNNLKKYDTVLFSCEGNTYPAEKSTAARQALLDYINMGGRVFASHWHNIWISGGPAPLNSIATFSTVAAGFEYKTPITASIYTTTPKGNALADWLLNVGGSSSRGSLQIVNARDSVLTIDNTRTERFVYYNDATRGKVAEQYFSFFAPIGVPAASQCGRMVFTDMHISGNDAMTPNPALDLSATTLPFPSGCVTSSLSAQETALLFLLFDLTNCVQPVLG
ncbi:MAG TPA: carboxypeptidase-like regulatory domain-containing protein [Pseudomonadota bacterium]|nr:carboxypeptidase-like regulatory domain-containing protein [Pseudomonadota bacterium]